MAKSTIEAIEKVMKKLLTPLETKICSLVLVIEKLEGKIISLETQLESSQNVNHNGDQKLLSTTDSKPNTPKPPLTQVKNSVAKLSKPSGRLATDRPRRESLPANTTSGGACDSRARRSPALQRASPDATDDTTSKNIIIPQPSSQDHNETANDQEAHDEVPSNEQWQVVLNKRFRKRPIKRTAVTGTGPLDTDLQTTERGKKIHVCFFKSCTTADAVKSYMQKKNDGANYAVEKLPLKHDHYASFALTVPVSKFDYFMTAENWPAGVEVSEWFRRSAGRRSRAPNNTISAGPASPRARNPPTAQSHHTNTERHTDAANK